jgi:hypothetical protein
MNRMNLNQLVNFLSTLNLTQTAHYFKGCANDSVTVDGLIESEFVKRHVIIGSETERSTKLWREIQANVTSYIFTDTPEDFKFTFETEDDQWRAEFTGYIESYDCVRMEVKKHGLTQDFPVKNKESYKRLLNVLAPHEIIRVYPTVHSYDRQDFL